MDLSSLSKIPVSAPLFIHILCYAVVYEGKEPIYVKKKKSWNNGKMTMNPSILLQTLPPRTFNLIETFHILFKAQLSCQLMDKILWDQCPFLQNKLMW